VPAATRIHIMATLLHVTAVAPRTGKTIRNCLNIFEEGYNFLQNGILHFYSSEIAFQSVSVEPCVE